MIVSIRHRGLAALHWKGESKGVKQPLVRRLRQVLALLETANTADDMAAPGLRLHPLKGEWRGFYSVTVSGNWRVVFRIADGKVEDVDLVDYH